jgi:hypothetical protein
MPRGKKPALAPKPPAGSLDAFCADVRQACPEWFESFQARRKALVERFHQKRAEDPAGVVMRLLGAVAEEYDIPAEAVAKLTKAICRELFDDGKASVYLCTPNEQAQIHKVLGLSESAQARLAVVRDEVLKERGLLRNNLPAPAPNVTVNMLSLSLPPDAPPDVRAWYERRALEQTRCAETALPAQAVVA